MKIVENHVEQRDDGKSYGIYDEVMDLADTYMGEDATIGDIFRAMQSEYGRCVSKVYQDTKDGIIAIGWVFQKREKYEDSKETFIHETWISLYDEYREEPVRVPHVIAHG